MILELHCLQSTNVGLTLTEYYNLEHKTLIFDCFECSFVGFFLLKYVLTQA